MTTGFWPASHCPSPHRMGRGWPKVGRGVSHTPIQLYAFHGARSDPYIIDVQILGYIAIAVVGYLIGSIPTGFLVAKSRGIDIRAVGSGNIGATNALRILGKRAGVFVLFVDALKGWLAVFVAGRIAPLVLPGAPLDYVRIAAGIAVILGHNYTCWLHFKGGKGIATSAGVLAALAPWTLVVALSTFAVGVLATRMVSVGSILAALSLPLATWYTTGQDAGLTLVTGAMGALAIYKHRLNIRRIISGTESRIQFKKKGAAP